MNTLSVKPNLHTYTYLKMISILAFSFVFQFSYNFPISIGKRYLKILKSYLTNFNYLPD